MCGSIVWLRRDITDPLCAATSLITVHPLQVRAAGRERGEETQMPAGLTAQDIQADLAILEFDVADAYTLLELHAPPTKAGPTAEQIS